MKESVICSMTCVDQGIINTNQKYYKLTPKERVLSEKLSL